MVHGLLSRAATECPLSHYARANALAAEACRERLGDEPYRRLFAEGRDAFAARAREQGREALCIKIRGDFPYAVR